MAKIHVIIPAGGAGTRLWPLSRRERPKFLLDLTGSGWSLLQMTVRRLLPLAETLTVVTGEKHAAQVARQLEQLDLTVPFQVLVEPSGRDSMPAIGFAAYAIRREYGDSAVAGSFAADHVIRDEAAFRAAVQAAARGAENRFLTTIGLTPTEPSSGYGYIEPSSETIVSAASPNSGFGGAAGGGSVRRAARFVEKPGRETAKRYVEAGYLWNAGMFLFRTGDLAAMLREHLPQMDANLTELVDTVETGGAGPIKITEEAKATSPFASNSVAHTVSPEFGGRVLAAPTEIWERLPRIAIDHALVEPVAAAGKVAVAIAPPIGWSDLGDFAALQQLGVAGTEALLIDSEGAFTLAVSLERTVGNSISTLAGSAASGTETTASTEARMTTLPEVDATVGAGATTRDVAKQIVVLGIPEALVVDTEDALLVTRLSEAQSVKKVVDRLRDRGQINLL